MKARHTRKRATARTRKAKLRASFAVKGPADVAVTRSGSGVVCIKQLRKRLGIGQRLMSRLVGLSLRNISQLETSQKKPSPPVQKHLNEIRRLQDALAEVMAPDCIAEWLDTPNDAFGKFKPVEVIERGEIDQIWQMLFMLRSGVPS